MKYIIVEKEEDFAYEEFDFVAPAGVRPRLIADMIAEDHYRRTGRTVDLLRIGNSWFDFPGKYFSS